MMVAMIMLPILLCLLSAGMICGGELCNSIAALVKAAKVGSICIKNPGYRDLVLHDGRCLDHFKTRASNN